MKKIIIALACMVALSSCQGNVCKINASFDDLQAEQVFVAVINQDYTAYERIDTVAVVGGKFTFSAEFDQARSASIGTPTGESVSVILVPGSTLTLSGNISGEYHMGGSKIYDSLDEVSHISDAYMAKLDLLQAQFNSDIDSGIDPNEANAKVQEEWAALIAEMAAAECRWAEAHPDSDASVYLLSRMETEDFEKYDPIVSDRAKNGPLAGLYNMRKGLYEREKERLEAEQSMVEGALAPDFRLPTPDGGTLALSDLRGKYVVIDFWGSWCYWCIKGMPDMKKYYEKYGSKLEILGVDCRDKEEAWKAAIKEHEISWKHVRNGGQSVTVDGVETDGVETDGSQFPDITSKYAIQGYPTKVLVDPDGRIVKYIIGEDPEFYTILDQVLK